MENVIRVDDNGGAPVANPQGQMERLQREHNELKARLSELNSRLYLSPEEEVERKMIQKLKLLKKDQLAFLSAIS